MHNELDPEAAFTAVEAKAYTIRIMKQPLMGVILVHKQHIEIASGIFRQSLH